MKNSLSRGSSVTCDGAVCIESVPFFGPMDSVTLACDAQVMTKVLKQGAEFDALAETDHNLTDRYTA